MKLIIHGGFFSESTANHATNVAKQQALKEIVMQSYEVLKTCSALKTVVYAVALLEDNQLFNAGIGSQIQSDGKIRMSAAIMDGETQKLSGATNFARLQGFEVFSTEIPQRRLEYEAKLKACGQGTVGCVALDNDGKLAAATSTGGKGFEIPGRISDSATVAGNYANQHCGVSLTGVGEDIMSNATAAKIVTRDTDGGRYALTPIHC